MSTHWDLTSLYTSFDDPKMDKDLQDVKDEIQSLKKWFDKDLNDNKLNDTDKITYILRQMTSIDYKMDRYAAYARLQSATDTTNQTALEKLNTIEALYPDYTQLEVMFGDYISKIVEFDKIISSSSYLQEHKYILQEMVEINKHSLDSDTESIIARMKNTGSSAWTKLHQQLLSTLQVELPAKYGLEEEIKPISAVRNMAYSQDENVRKRAYESELEAYKKITLPMSACLNGIKGEAITQTELRGFSSPLDMTLFYSRMDNKILDALLKAIEEGLPIVRKYLKKKAQVLGYDNGLPWYELYAPLGKEVSKITYEEAKHIVYDNFRSFNPNLADFAQMAFDKNWIDVEPRAGKRGGAFCSNLPIGESRVLLNFDGALTNVITLAHELGHGYHGHCLKDEELLNRSYTMPIAETASTFCETIIIKSALASWDDKKRFEILNDQVIRYVGIIMDIYSRFVFEKALFEKRKNATLSVGQICDLMADAQEKAYGDALDYRFNHPYMWVNKVHYYYASRNYYNFPYAFGLLLAKGLYAMYENEGDSFLSKYDTLLRETGKNSIYGIGQSVGIDLTNVRFFRGGLGMIEDDINMLVDLIDRND
ncbi:M3 family oligoendopeptidase [Vallitalea sp.]|jgi:pepF/M3 family oligoendopeptidase|uniref:M3 family oligoendopeptidase n=1 Tax=Vallitalea sp. TaxID=1882829 RepID=UPI0025F45335|nr:M3 family oligoendopeptidase [Vallitalea sp.]MCT4686892.1 M3 family oligoendopeptidase [Vallitalea sp.]